MTGIIWFRRDLRLADQAALIEACNEGQVRAVGIHPKSQVQNPNPHPLLPQSPNGGNLNKSGSIPKVA